MASTLLTDVPEVAKVTVALNERGEITYGGAAVPRESTSWHLSKVLRVPRNATDIFVFVHGWRTSPQEAGARASRFFGGLMKVVRGGVPYEMLGDFWPYFVNVTWPSQSPLWGYGGKKELAHEMTTSGQAARILAQLLGFLHADRKAPTLSRNMLKTRDGQFLHCVGHSFGGRFLGEAIKWAANPPRSTLDWPWKSEHPFGVDSFTVFQMAAEPDIFEGRLAPLQSTAPLHGPIVLTFSASDRAAGLGHRAVEGTPGIGAVGAVAGAHPVTTLRLKQVTEPYSDKDFPVKVVNVDASWLFGTSEVTLRSGGHSDFQYEESAHLVLSLANLSRQADPGAPPQ